MVGTDLSESASIAVAQAAAWASRTKASLLVVHVASERVLARLDTAKTAETLRAAVGAALKGGVSIEVEIVAGSPHGELIRIADARTAPLLVVGASGHGRLEQAIFGSTAQQVVRYAHCPVLVARVSPEAGPILVATDFSETALPALRFGVEEARRRGTEVLALYSIYEGMSPFAALGPLVVSPPEPTETEIEALEAAAAETLKSLMESVGAPPKFAVSRAAPSTAIIDEAKQRGAALIVVGTRGKTGLARIALGSVAEAVVRQASCSVLAVRV